MDGIELVETYVKYWDKYEVGETEKQVQKTEDTWRNTDICKEDGSSEANQKRIDITKERYEKLSKKQDGTSRIGDGLFEIIKDYSYNGVFSDNETWNWIQIDKTTADKASFGLGYYNGDASMIGNCTQTFLLRGGAYWDATRAGVFNSADVDGEPNEVSGFRPVLVV